LNSLENLAAACTYQGRWGEAEKLEVLVLEKRREILGDDHPDTVRAMVNLAMTYHRLGQLNKAEELEVVVLEKHSGQTTQIL
jgi:hypothetical protein